MAPVVNRPHPIVKKALLIAVQYRCSNSGDSLTSLDTTPEDVYAFRKLLIRTCLHVAISCHSAHKLPGIGHFSYEEQNIQVLVDGVDSSSPYLKKLGLSEENNFAPTYDNIVRRLSFVGDPELTLLKTDSTNGGISSKCETVGPLCIVLYVPLSSSLALYLSLPSRSFWAR